MPAAIIATRHVPSAARLMQLLLLIYLAPTGMTVTALPRATRTTGPVGMAAAGSDGAEPAGALDCWAGTLLRSKRETYRSEEHPSELQSLLRLSYAVLCMKKNRSGTGYQPT